MNNCIFLQLNFLRKSSIMPQTASQPPNEVLEKEILHWKLRYQYFHKILTRSEFSKNYIDFSKLLAVHFAINFRSSATKSLIRWGEFPPTLTLFYISFYKLGPPTLRYDFY